LKQSSLVDLFPSLNPNPETLLGVPKGIVSRTPLDHDIKSALGDEPTEPSFLASHFIFDPGFHMMQTEVPELGQPGTEERREELNPKVESVSIFVAGRWLPKFPPVSQRPGCSPTTAKL
jgi:hypothetical protein